MCTQVIPRIPSSINLTIQSFIRHSVSQSVLTGLIEFTTNNSIGIGGKEKMGRSNARRNEKNTGRGRNWESEFQTWRRCMENARKYEHDRSINAGSFGGGYMTVNLVYHQNFVKGPMQNEKNVDRGKQKGKYCLS